LKVRAESLQLAASEDRRRSPFCPGRFVALPTGGL